MIQSNGVSPIGGSQSIQGVPSVAGTRGGSDCRNQMEIDECVQFEHILKGVSMIRVTVLYPSAEGSTFDIDYYANKHIPMVQGLLGDALKGGGVEKGIGTAEPGAPAPFMASGFIEFDSVDDFEASFGPNADQIMGDIPNFTNVDPVVQIAEIVA